MAKLIEIKPLGYNERRCTDCHEIFTRSYDHRSDKRCYGCDHDHKEATINPIELGNRHNYAFTGEDMRYYRFRVSDLRNGGNAREAKAEGLTLKRNGRLRRYYDADGTLIYAYSYDTCIYARVFDVAEGYWRDVFNFTPYSKTSREHQNDVLRECLGIGHWQWVQGIGAITWEGEYPDSVRVDHPFSERARRAAEMVRVEVSTSYTEYVTHADEFINRKEDDARIEARRQGVNA